MQDTTRLQFLESRLQACELNNAANCGLTLINPDKKIVRVWPSPTHQVRRVPGQDNHRARWRDSRFELGFISGPAERDVRSGVKGQCSYKNNGELGAGFTAADHEAGEIEVGPRCIGRVRDGNGIGSAIWMMRTHQMPAPSQFGTE
jgi:hypothetical protein